MTSRSLEKDTCNDPNTPPPQHRPTRTKLPAHKPLGTQSNHSTHSRTLQMPPVPACPPQPCQACSAQGGGGSTLNSHTPCHMPFHVTLPSSNPASPLLTSAHLCSPTSATKSTALTQRVLECSVAWGISAQIHGPIAPFPGFCGASAGGIWLFCLCSLPVVEGRCSPILQLVPSTCWAFPRVS